MVMVVLILTQKMKVPFGLYDEPICLDGKM